MDIVIPQYGMRDSSWPRRGESFFGFGTVCVVRNYDGNLVWLGLLCVTLVCRCRDEWGKCQFLLTPFEVVVCYVCGMGCCLKIQASVLQCFGGVGGSCSAGNGSGSSGSGGR